VLLQSFGLKKKLVFQQENHRSLSRRPGKRSTVYPMWYIFFTHPSPNRKGVVFPFPPPPLRPLYSSFVPTPPLGVCGPVFLPCWQWVRDISFKKISFKTGLKDGAGTAAWSEEETQKNTHPEPHIIFLCWGVSYLYHLANAWVTERANTGFFKKSALSAQKTRVWTH
jgi:hypothetical protein